MDMRDDPRERKRLGRITGGPLIEIAEDRETIPISPTFASEMPFTRKLHRMRRNEPDTG